jgi:hypothetical protein
MWPEQCPEPAFDPADMVVPPTFPDPHEARNLATDPAFEAEKTRLRQALESWIDDVGDMGDIPEFEMVRRWYPDGMPPQTAAPVFIPISPDAPGIEPAAADYTHTLTRPAVLQLYCATQGASMAYTIATGNTDTAPRWQLYTEPLGEVIRPRIPTHSHPHIHGALVAGCFKKQAYLSAIQDEA